MPGMDGTGPLGLGPGTGRGRGNCNGRRRFFRSRFSSYNEPVVLTKEQEKKILEEEAKDLEEGLKQIREKLKEMK